MLVILKWCLYCRPRGTFSGIRTGNAIITSWHHKHLDAGYPLGIIRFNLIFNLTEVNVEGWVNPHPQHFQVAHEMTAWWLWGDNQHDEHTCAIVLCSTVFSPIHTEARLQNDLLCFISKQSCVTLSVHLSGLCCWPRGWREEKEGRVVVCSSCN